MNTGSSWWLARRADKPRRLAPIRPSRSSWWLAWRADKRGRIRYEYRHGSSWWLAWRVDESKLCASLTALRHGTRVGRHLFSAMGAAAMLFALTIWLVPASRNALAAKLAPSVVAAGQPQSGAALPTTALDSSTVADVNSHPVNGNQAAHAINTNTATASTSTGAGAVPTAQQRSASGAHGSFALSAHEQALVASYLSRHYRVAQQPVNALVKAASSTGHDVGLDPLLLLAVIGIESSFNPYAQSNVGAQGLMQVMPRVHLDKLQPFGGLNATLNPQVNIHVGALVLKDCIARGGSLAGGLRLYSGSALKTDNSYGARVMAERERLRDVALGLKVPAITPSSVATSPSLVVVRNTGKPVQRVQVVLNGSHHSARDAEEVSVKAQQSSANTQAEEGT